jgi:glycosyltransferase involved in cell wall biosynthesis
MLLLIYCAINDDTIESSLGDAEYSYYFVYRQFLKALNEAYFVIPVEGEIEKIESYYQNCLARGEACFCLYFSQPHKIPTHLACPIIPVFAWEFDTLPRDTDKGMDQDWGWKLAKYGWAITHSNYAVNCVKDRIRNDFPVVSIPSPVWDDFKRCFVKKQRSPKTSFGLQYRGSIIDSAVLETDRLEPESWKSSLKELMNSLLKQEEISLSINGVVYLSVFNPYDQRKNWQDMLRAFCWEFKRTIDATLILKISHKDANACFPQFLKELYKLSPFSCRVLIVHGYLEEKVYSELVKNSDYVVNCSYGEGQCLPLMEGMSAGKPAVSPDHTAMRDYLRPDNAFIVKSSPEPAFWPHDPRQRLRALRYRIDWKSLCNSFQKSYRMVKEEPTSYQKMSLTAYQTMREHCSRKNALGEIKDFLASRRDEYRAFDRKWRSRSYSFQLRFRRLLRPFKRRLLPSKPQ